MEQSLRRAITSGEDTNDFSLAQKVLSPSLGGTLLVEQSEGVQARQCPVHSSAFSDTNPNELREKCGSLQFSLPFRNNFLERESYKMKSGVK